MPNLYYPQLFYLTVLKAKSMKKQFLGHTIFWTLLIAIDISGYIPIWRKIMGIVASINYSWILIIFYSAYIAGLSFFSDEKAIRTWRKYQVWIIASLPFVYMLGSFITDKYILHIYGSPTTLWSYCVSRFIMIYPFIGSAIFLAGYRTNTIQFKAVRKERNDLLIENNYLDEDKTMLTQEKEQLLKEIHFLKFEVIASREQVASLRREYDEKLEDYKRMIDRLKGGNDFS